MATKKEIEAVCAMLRANVSVHLLAIDGAGDDDDRYESIAAGILLVAEKVRE